MEHTAQRVHAPAVAAPGPALWPQIRAESDAYRHISTTGVWLHGQSTWVQAATELGSGFWLLTPLRVPDGWTVLVNRGFVPAEARAAWTEQLGRTPESSDQTTQAFVSGLLRITEPGGAFLRTNDPRGGHWYSRDVAAIAAAHGLSRVAPYFVDADAATSPDAPDTRLAPALQPPIGGLTVVDFHNNHLVYALTWYTLALMVAGAAWRVAREERLQQDKRDLAKLQDDAEHTKHG